MSIKMDGGDILHLVSPADLCPSHTALGPITAWPFPGTVPVMSHASWLPWLSLLFKLKLSSVLFSEYVLFTSMPSSFVLRKEARGNNPNIKDTISRNQRSHRYFSTTFPPPSVIFANRASGWISLFPAYDCLLRCFVLYLSGFLMPEDYCTPDIKIPADLIFQSVNLLEIPYMAADRPRMS